MMIGNRLRALRAAKKLSQGDVEKRSGIPHCTLSRVENGHNVPAIDTLEKWARALGIPMYQLFYEGEAPPKIPKDISHLGPDERGRAFWLVVISLRCGHVLPNWTETTEL